MKIFLTLPLIFFILSCNDKKPINSLPSLEEKSVQVEPIEVISGKQISVNKNDYSQPKNVKSPASLFITMQNYNTGQGLALSSIISGYRDSTGNLWFGTDGGGVSKFDGKSFTNFTKTNGLAGNSVMCIQQDTLYPTLAANA